MGCLFSIIGVCVIFAIVGFIFLPSDAENSNATSGSNETSETTTDTTKETTTTTEQFKDSCDSYTYEKIARDPEKYKGKMPSLLVK